MGLRSRAGGKSKVKGSARATLAVGGVTREYDEEIFDFPHDTPASRAGASLSARRSENYQSAELEVWVEVPCTPGTEVAAAEFCLDKCSAVLKSNEDDLYALVQSLS